MMVVLAAVGLYQNDFARYGKIEAVFKNDGFGNEKGKV